MDLKAEEAMNKYGNSQFYILVNIMASCGNNPESETYQNSYIKKLKEFDLKEPDNTNFPRSTKKKKKRKKILIMKLKKNLTVNMRMNQMMNLMVKLKMIMIMSPRANLTMKPTNNLMKIASGKYRGKKL